MPHLGNRLRTTTQTSFASRSTGLRGQTRRPVPITGGLGGARLPNIRSKGNLGAQVSALKRV